VVVGHTNLDHFLRVERLPATDRTVPVRERVTRLGGTAANIARTAAKLGVRTSLVSRVGSDFPVRFRHLLKREGVDLTAFDELKEAHSPACFIVESEGGEQVTLIDQGPMAADPGTRLPTELLRQTSWVHLATGDPQYQLRMQAEARRLGRRVAADPAQEVHYRWEAPALRRLLGGSEILFANGDELARVRQILGRSSVRSLLELVPTIIETRGDEGAIAWTRAGAVRVPAIRPRKIRQVTGAGDGFRGGFYAGWFRGAPLREALLQGTRAAAHWLETGDPSRLDRPGA
jgi:sugar/nucleoside kinase (ribokinase family)